MPCPARLDLALARAGGVDGRDKRQCSLDGDEHDVLHRVGVVAAFPQNFEAAIVSLTGFVDVGGAFEAITLTDERVDDVELYGGVVAQVGDSVRGNDVCEDDVVVVEESRGALRERFGAPSGQTVAMKPSRWSKIRRCMSSVRIAITSAGARSAACPAAP
jgi:hypothetical protein